MASPSTQPAGPWLHRFAVFTAAATLALVVAGGLVTSHGAGMAVPDWPNTYDYNMFFFPISKWVGGIFYEHTHRLLASGVGLLTSVLALWLHGRSARPLMRWLGLGLLVLGIAAAAVAPRRWADGVVLGATGLVMFGASFVWPACQPSPKWLRRLGVIAFLAVVLQGVLGGLRVVLIKDQLGIFHATLAQVFFVLLCAIALFTSRWWKRNPKAEIRRPKEGRNPKSEDSLVGSGFRVSGFGLPSDFGLRISDFKSLRALFLIPTLLILCQLILGATMRHQHAGLAIPDFPLAYGKVWPTTDATSVAHYNQQRMEAAGENPITAGQIVLQMVHRGMAAIILAGVGSAAWLAARRLGGRHALSRLALAWLALLLVQVLLGAATIWSGKAADIATGHVLAGALSLALGAVLSLISFRELALAPLATGPGRISAPPSERARPRAQQARQWVTRVVNSIPVFNRVRRAESGRGLPHSRTLARNPERPRTRQRLGVRQPSAAFRESARLVEIRDKPSGSWKLLRPRTGALRSRPSTAASMD